MRTRVRKQPIIALKFEFESPLKFYYLGTSSIFLSNIIAKLDWTPRKTPQNRDPIQTPQTQWEQQQTIDKQQQQNHHLRKYTIHGHW